MDVLVDWEKMPWDEVEGEPQKGFRSKTCVRDGQEVDLIEFAEGYVRDSWCTQGHLLHVLAGESTSPSEYVFIAKDGTRKVGEVRYTPLVRDGDIVGLVGMIRDITERKKAEEALRDSEERFREVFEKSPLGMAIIDLNFKFQEVNKTSCEMLGYSEEELAMLTFAHITYRDDIDDLLEAAEKMRDGEIGFFNLEKRFRRKDGDILWLSVTASLMRDEEGNPLYAIVMAEDVTERKRLEEERRKLNEELERRVVVRTAQLEAANKEMEAFSYSVSHDLQTPLRAIGGFTRMLNDEYSEALDDEGQRLLSIICQNTDYMGELIDHLLTLSRVGRREMTETEVDMNALVRQTVGELELSMNGRQVAWTIGELPPVHGDAVMYYQVWINLLSNAVKFTGKKETAVIEVGHLPGDSDNTYFVKDNGAGFDMKYADRLFGVFRRLHSPEDFEGVGVGLALVQRIVRRHGGSVWAEGEVDKGATFYFTVPARKA